MRKLTIDLSGPDGNAWALMGIARSIAQQIGVDPKPITRDMRSSDYANLLRVFRQHFGEYVDIVNDPSEDAK